MTKASARRLADRMVELGMLDAAKSAEVLADIDEYSDPGEGADTPLGPRDLTGYLPSFGVAVTIHVDDVDFVDEYYRSVFEDDIAAVTGGAVVVTDVTLLEDEDGDEWLYFVRNGEPSWWAMEHQSHDYVDAMTVFENFNDFDPGGDDPREFFLYDPKDPDSMHDQFWVLATREQALVLRQEFGIDFLGLDTEPPTGPEADAEAAEFLADWTSGMEQRLRLWREDEAPRSFPFDFSLSSLEILERMVVNLYPDKAAFEADQGGRFLVGAAAYAGETLIRVASGVWDYRIGGHLYDRAVTVVSDTPQAFQAIVHPSALLRRLAEDRDFGVLAAAAQELRESAAKYAAALRALESDDEDIEDDED